MTTGDVRVDPVVGSPAATIDLGNERLLAIADYHAGIEAGLRYERGVELDSNAAARRDRLLALIEETAPDRLVVLGDLAHRIGEPIGREEDELSELFDAVCDRVPVLVARGNHDAGLEEFLAQWPEVSITEATGTLLSGANGSVGLLHGHTWPDRSLLSASIVCMGHEHPTVRLTDAVGGARVEPAWLRGRLDRSRVLAELDDSIDDDSPGGTGEVDRSRVSETESGRDESVDGIDPELVVFPAFNDRSGGTWINVDGQGFLSPLLPETLYDGQAYLLDGTRLGPYRSI